VAGTLGYCGLDRTRAPLHGDEQRGCWEGRAAVTFAPDAESLSSHSPGGFWTDERT
jgi:hypothetical protein